MAYKILIADDEAMLTELLSDHLKNCGKTAFLSASLMMD